MEKLAYVICCNDSIKFVVLDDESVAISKMDELKIEDFKENGRQYNNDISNYLCYYFWHLHEVKYIG